MAGRPDEEKKRARDFVAAELRRQERSVEWLEATAKIDSKQMRAFLAAESYPQRGPRERMEKALGLTTGMIDDVARLGGGASDDRDPVDVAIDRSGLTERNKRHLKVQYHDMLEDQEREGRAS